MRRSLVRDVGLLFPIAVLLVLSCLAVVQWNRTGAIQQVRDATIVSGGEANLLQSLAGALRYAEASQQAYLLSGASADLGTFQAAARNLESLSARLRDRAASDAAAGPAVKALVTKVDQRQQALGRAVVLRHDGLLTGAEALRGTADDQHVLDRVAHATQALEGSQQSGLRRIGGGIRTLRWITAAGAALALLGMIAALRQFRRSWRRLSKAETEQRLLAQQLRGSLDSLSQGVAVFSADGRLLNWNLRLRQMLELPESILRHGLPYEALERQLAGAGEAFLEPPSTVANDDGSPVVYERVSGETQVEIRRTTMPQGGFVLTLTDMTERAHAEQMLREAQKMQALGQLTGGIAHDFNNMLTVILGSLEVSADELAAAGETRQVALLTARMVRAAQAAENGAALTRQLLNFARKQPLAPAALDLASVLPNLMPLLRHTLGETIALSFTAEAGLWPAIVDTAQLESAVLNLALNARDAMPHGGRLAIEAANVVFEGRATAPHRDLPPGSYVRVTVVDSGEGMSREVIARAFEPFFTTKPEGLGTGLGLAMVFAFARQCGGLAMINSEPGRGAAIQLFLPRAHETLVSAPSNAAAPGAGLPEAPRVEARIMVVEDDAAVRGIAAEIMRELGYGVSEAADAEDAMRQLARQAGPLDLLLTDLALPGAMDGRALAVRVRQTSPATRVLFMSGSLDEQAAGTSEPATRWLAKPFRRTQLAAAVAELVA